MTDGRNVYVFFGDFGLLAFDWNGKEQWRLPRLYRQTEWPVKQRPVVPAPAHVAD